METSGGSHLQMAEKLGSSQAVDHKKPMALQV